MNDAMPSTEGAERGHEAEQASLTGSTLLFAWLSVGLGLVAGACISFWVGRQVSWLIGLLPASAGGALGVLAIRAGARNLRQALLLMLREKEANCQRMLSELQVQLGESRRSEELLRQAQA